MGAIKAIEESYRAENIDITSIIGSSAGGIVALAVCCRIDTQGIIDLCSNYLSKVTDDITYEKNTKETEDMVNNYFKIIEGVCRDYNIVDDQII